MIWTVVGVVQPGPQQFDLMNSGSPSLLWHLSTTYWSLIIGYKSLLPTLSALQQVVVRQGPQQLESDQR